MNEQAATRLRECQAGSRLSHLTLYTWLWPLLTAVCYVNVQSVWKALHHVGSLTKILAYCPEPCAPTLCKTADAVADRGM